MAPWKGLRAVDKRRMINRQKRQEITSLPLEHQNTANSLQSWSNYCQLVGDSSNASLHSFQSKLLFSWYRNRS